MITPKDYQRKDLNSIVDKFKTTRKLLYQLSTGGGKTYVFSFLSQYWTKKYNCRALVLCHREELVHQCVESMNKIGVTCETVLSGKRKLNHSSEVYASMIDTAYNRVRDNPYFFHNVGLVVCDETHVRVFHKIFEFFPKAKILGVTATPVVLDRVTFFKCKYCKTDYTDPVECCDEEVEEWTKPFSMSQIYEDIVVGPPINELIERGNLVQEISFVKDYADTDNLKTDNTGEFTTKSLDEVYSNDDAVFNVLLNYKELCEGKKTIIFNSSSKNNLMVYRKFKESGLNVRMFDSVNIEESGCRKELVKWFKETPGAILMNVGIFVAGFDCKEVEATILNVSTNSLSQFLQMVGRAVRTSDEIYKPHAVVVDGGGNIARHLEFSDPTRDWKRIFFEGLGKSKPKKQDAFDINSCPECGALYMKSEPECPECGYIIPPPEKKAPTEKSEGEEVMMPIRKIPPPSGESIYLYTLKRGENINFAFKIMINQVVDLFRFYRVSKDTYLATKKSGKMEKRIGEIIRKCYFVLLAKKDIQTEGRRTLAHLYKRTIEKLDKYYDI